MPTYIPVISATEIMKTLKQKFMSACFISRLTFIVISLLFVNDMKAAGNISLLDSLSRTMTVAKVYEEKYSEPGTTKVIFYESARFYKILKTNPHYKDYISLLRAALKKQKPVSIRFTKPNGDIIDVVNKIRKNSTG
jgi:hypothetical protein